MGTGLNVAFQRRRQTPGQSDSATSSESCLLRHRAPVAKKATARPPINPATSLSSQTSSNLTESAIRDEKDPSIKYSEEDSQNSLYSQVCEWLQHEKSKRGCDYSLGSGVPDEAANGGQVAGSKSTGNSVEEASSLGAQIPMALDKLEKILLQYAASRQDNGAVRRLRRHRSRGLRRGSASESDFSDLDVAAPSVDVVLDNSKTLAYSGGGAEDDESEDGTNSRYANDREAWTTFKTEILRLAHTLQFKGWRKLPMDSAVDIEVIRLSGALTNAVYVVNPPQNITVPKAEDGSYSLVPRKPPPKLLLRIYGPQVDHLIDRENELQILRRLGRKNIGPKVLGTFQNGRFEEYFEARPLTPQELRDPLTMKQIAKRMRELHDGVELLAEEREGGPMVFKNWDKWVDRCEQVTNWLDKEIRSEHNASISASEPWRRRGFVCGVPWPVFRKAVDNYRKWLISSCGGIKAVKQQLVFAHNDTQYGNLLRMEPSRESPLLRPENKHKQLVVIDFEYASANTPGFEFANHFSEWCYNYHDAERPWACNNMEYPTVEQQRQFISAYLSHRPGLREQASPSITPLMRAGTSNTTTLAPLSLDAGPDMDMVARVDIEKAHADGVEAKIQGLMTQTKLWRVITSAQWVAWGIVQAKVPGMEEGIKTDVAASNGQSHSVDSNGAHAQTTTDAAVPTPPVDADVDEADEFDYLAYAQDRAMFFWSDLLSMGFVQEDELPMPMVEKIKARIIKY
ncbi:putative choline kinase [Aspergillus saccharolyticus JOP 1030-1]|uniref:Kinase-like protein n=1 Tax=Aspergillus saccharolyticus JOP 1030-1 TaxID=1450539 RepID=A0A318ZI14_9EURO|nr:kinase-like protein [Aspergillus saccharolyticus JOP 1030-1]PYH43340.1 kinase-like protein [Aspergillus saccharolyticus JOP 1030-1]